MKEKCDMQLQDFYEMLGGSYQEIKERLQSDELILRLTFKFLNDKSYENLCRAVEEEDYEEAFRWYQRGAEVGIGDGQTLNALANCYYWGNGVAQDKEKAYELFVP